MTEIRHRRKLIEVALPLEVINAASVREKSIRHGHPSTLHHWWARRPLAACRAVLFGQLVDDPSSWPDRFPTEQAQEEERSRLFELIEQLVKWKNFTNKHVLNDARFEIARTIAWNKGEEPPTKLNPKAVLTYLQDNAPPVYDPFCGGGSIPLEAQRLGLRSHGSDLNPVAVLISKLLVEIPGKFAGQSPINPDYSAEEGLAKCWNGKGAEGLADDVRYYGRWICDEAKKKIGHLYPKIKITEEIAGLQPDLKPLLGQKLTVLAWLWVRNIPSPNPTFSNYRTPLASTFFVGRKEGRPAVIVPTVDRDRGIVDYDVHQPAGNEEIEKFRRGTKAGRGTFRCIYSDAPITSEYLKDMGRRKEIGEELFTVVAIGQSRRIYLPPSCVTVEILDRTDFMEDLDCPNISGYFNPPIYGYTTIGSLFNNRQKIAIETFASLVEEALALCRSDGASKDYAEAVAVALALGVSRMANRMSSFSTWDAGRENIAQIFSEQGVPMVWDYAEANPFSGASGSWEGSLEWVPKVIERSSVTPSKIDRGDAQSVRLQEPSVISTDPPYYSSITYADFSDFFYAVLRGSLRSTMPEFFATIATPKSKEVVAAWHRFDGNKDAAGRYFTRELKASVKNIFAQGDNGFPKVVYYAFKSQELGDNSGQKVTAWESILGVLIECGMWITSTFPLRTELTGGRKSSKNTLASSIVIVGRDRPTSAKTITRVEFLRALRHEFPTSLQLLQEGNIAPVDMAQASIGSGMAVFTRYAKVMEADDTTMTVKTALQLINAALDEFLTEQEGEYDPHTRFAITWFESHGMAAADFGEAETLATARNVSVVGVVDAGLIEARGNRVRLLPREEMPVDWQPANNSRPTVWEASQHLIRRLEMHGEESAADLLHRLGSSADPARDLAYRMYQICERNKWAEEGHAYNSLITAWPELVKLSQQHYNPLPI